MPVKLESSEKCAVADDVVSMRHRTAIVAVVAYVWVRVIFVLIVRPFETPDTQSYRSGQNVRPPIAAALLSWLGDTPYVAVSSLVSTLGFVTLAWALWNPLRRYASLAMIGVVGVVSLAPMVVVYEHWLIPDSLLTGLALTALALASRRVGTRWYPWSLVVICVVITCTKEVGFGVVLLVASVMILRRTYRAAVGAVLLSALLFAFVVLPGSNREGRVLWDQPTDTELTMERFRVVIAGTFWADLSTELAEVRTRADECGMTGGQILAETFRLTDDIVAFQDCPALWVAVDETSQVDILEAHVRNPVHVRSSVERGFSPDMSAMAAWGGFVGGHHVAMRWDQRVAVVVALLPFGAVVCALLRRRGRWLAIIATAASSMALVAVLLDPSSQDRHAIVFRISAFALALLAVSELTRTRSDEADGTGDIVEDRSEDDAVVSSVTDPACVS